MISSEKPSLPRRLLITLQLGGGLFALANIICVAILGYVYLSVKHVPKTLEVKGSAKKAIVSDTISWTATFSARDSDLIKAYEKINNDAQLVAEFIKKAGVPDKEVTFSSISTNKIYERQTIPNPNSSPTILTTNKVEFYELSQNVTVESRDMNKVPAISRNATSLIQEGIEIESYSPHYLYSKLSELKIDMLAEATKDATLRATQIVENANGSLGKLVEARMGVMQINPKGVTDVSGTGNNDTTSLEKEILAVVTVEFELK